MKTLLTAALASVLLTGVAVAQTTTTTTTTTAGSGSSTTVVIDQSTLPKVKQYIATQKTTAANVPSGFSLSVGAELPQTVTLHDFGADVGVKNYKYVVINDRAAIVDPQTRKVVQIVETK